MSPFISISNRNSRPKFTSYTVRWVTYETWSLYVTVLNQISSNRHKHVNPQNVIQWKYMKQNEPHSAGVFLKVKYMRYIWQKMKSTTLYILYFLPSAANADFGRFCGGGWGLYTPVKSWCFLTASLVWSSLTAFPEKLKDKKVIICIAMANHEFCHICMQDHFALTGIYI